MESCMSKDEVQAFLVEGGVLDEFIP